LGPYRVDRKRRCRALFLPAQQRISRRREGYGKAMEWDNAQFFRSYRHGRCFRCSHLQILFSCQLAVALVTQRIAPISQNLVFMERVVKETRGCSHDLGTPFTSSTFLRLCCLPSHNVVGLVAELLSASDEPNAPTESAHSSKRRGKIVANEQRGTAVRSNATPLNADDK
jgi:hypothetical protein